MKNGTVVTCGQERNKKAINIKGNAWDPCGDLTVHNLPVMIQI